MERPADLIKVHEARVITVDRGRKISPPHASPHIRGKPIWCVMPIPITKKDDEP